MKKTFSIFLSLCMAISLLPVLSLNAKAAGEVKRVSGNISSDTTWSNDKLYVLEDNVIINSDVTLTIEPGVIVKVFDAAIIVNGTLNINGSSESHITLTSINDDIGGDTNENENSPSLADWAGIIIKPCGSATLSHADIKYSGQFSSDDNYYGTCIDKKDGANLTMSNCVLSDCARKSAICLVGAGTAVITNTTISGAEKSGLHINNCAASISGGSFTNNDEYGIRVDCAHDYDQSLPSIENASFSGNGYGAVYLCSQAAGTSITNCDLPGQFIKIASGPVSRNVMLSSDATYYVDGNVTVLSTFGISSGTVIKLNSAGNFTIGDGGALTTYGTEDKKVVMTSWRDNDNGENIGDKTAASRGNWAGIIIRANGTATLSHTDIKYSGIYYSDFSYYGTCINKKNYGNLTMSNCVLSYCATKSAICLVGAGAANITYTSISGAVDDGIHYTNAASPTISNCTIMGNGKGINIHNSRPNIFNCIINNNATGIYITGTSNPIIGGSLENKNTISLNTDYGVSNASGKTVIATHNNWGEPSGPYNTTTNPNGLGNEVSDYVDFMPFETFSKPTLQSASTNSDGTKLILTFDKAMADPAGKEAEFTVSADGNANIVTAATLNDTENTKIELAITTAIAKGQTVTVSYTAGTVAAADSALLDGFSSQSVTNSVVSHGTLRFVAGTTETEPLEGSSSLIKVDRVNGTDGEISVSYTITEGTALANVNYVAYSGTLTWGDNEAGIKTIDLTTIQDNTYNGYLTMTYILFNPTGGAVLESDSLPIRISDSNNPPIPTGLTSIAGNRQVTLSWDSVKDAHYKVYCSETSGNFTDADIVAIVNDQTSYTVPNLSNDTTYYFAITAGHVNKYSDFSQQSEATPRAPSSGGIPANSNIMDVKTQDGGTTVSGVLTTTDRGLKVEISSENFKKLDEGKQPIVIDTQEAMVVFDACAVGYINSQLGTGDVNLTIEQADLSKFSKDIRDMLADFTVYEFNLTSNGNCISYLGGGNAEISIPYTLQDGEDHNAIIVYYVDSLGKLVNVVGRYDAQSGTVQFTTKHFSAYAVGYNFVSFSDVIENDWYYDAVTFCAARNITNGIGNGSFGPDNTLTRAQFLVMLMRAYGIEADGDTADNFLDAGDTYYTGYLAAAKRLGIANGFGSGLFLPDTEISRQDMFTLLYRTLEFLGEFPTGNLGKTLSDFTDANELSDYATDAVKALINAGVISGSNNELSPRDASNRAQMAQLLYNLLSK